MNSIFGCKAIVSLHNERKGKEERNANAWGNNTRFTRPFTLRNNIDLTLSSDDDDVLSSRSCPIISDDKKIDDDIALVMKDQYWDEEKSKNWIVNSFYGYSQAQAINLCGDTAPVGSCADTNPNSNSNSNSNATATSASSSSSSSSSPLPINHENNINLFVSRQVISMKD
ncbi:hypothetical protein RFI_07543, partial [Reticulomyxa filosa]